jgi:hypothetical protein
VIYRAMELPEFILMDATQSNDLNEHLEQIKPEPEAEQNKKHLMKVILILRHHCSLIKNQNHLLLLNAICTLQKMARFQQVQAITGRIGIQARHSQTLLDVFW